MQCLVQRALKLDVNPSAAQVQGLSTEWEGSRRQEQQSHKYYFTIVSKINKVMRVRGLMCKVNTYKRTLKKNPIGYNVPDRLV